MLNSDPYASLLPRFAAPPAGAAGRLVPALAAACKGEEDEQG